MTARPHVLIVDDDEWLAAHFGRTLDSAGYDTTHAAHALQAIDMCDERTPDVILLDLFLPGPNGLTLIHELQSHADLGKVPIILCSTSGGDITPQQAKPYGIVSVLDKSTVQPQDVVAAVRKATI